MTGPASGNLMPELPLLTCIACVTRIEPTSPKADGWVLLQR